MKEAYISLFLLSFSFYSFSGPKCLSGAELPFQQVISDKTGLGNALAIAQKITPLDENLIDAVCISICGGNKENFLNSILSMMEQLPEAKGTKEEKIKAFFNGYYTDALCEVKLLTNGNKSCSHQGENFLRTAYWDRVDNVVEQMVLVYGVNLNQKDPDDNLSTVEWLDLKCKDKELLEADRKYFCTVLPIITCRAFRQLPKDQQYDPPKGCTI